MQRNRSGGFASDPCPASCWEAAELRIASLATSVHSDLHGAAHWRSVALAGARICTSLPDADLLTVLLFAITHDACRLSDDEDPEHGTRAAGSLELLLGDWAGDLAPWRRQLLAAACRDHADGHCTDNPTIGACWDADRLCLWRGDTEPVPSLMSTGPGKSNSLILWAQDLHLMDITWDEVAAVTGTGRLNCPRCDVIA
jgi:uncharacterized protein